MWQYFSSLHIQLKQPTIRTSLVADVHPTSDRWQHHPLSRSKVGHTVFKYYILRLTSLRDNNLKKRKRSLSPMGIPNYEFYKPIANAALIILYANRILILDP